MKPLTPPWNWDAFAEGSADWRAAWEDLGQWVQWYTETYELRSMPVCWYRHSRLVEELRALRFHHEAVFASVSAGEDGLPRAPGPSARAYSDWMMTRREWERTVLGLNPGDPDVCTGFTHAELSATTARGRAHRLQAMTDGLAAMLEEAVPESGP